MAVIPFLNGGEPVTAARMNTLMGGLESKMEQMLSGKSFLVGQRGAQGVALDPIPPHLMGRCFFFTQLVYSNGAVFYAPQCPEYLADGTDARNYDQAQFTDAITDDVVVTTYDEVNKVANIERLDAGLYDGLPQHLDVGFFEHCLFPAYVLYQGAGDTEPVKYYLREASAASGGGALHPPPEKYLRFGLAELILESDSYDGGGLDELFLSEEDYEEAGDTRIGKFGCYRLHNLQAQECTVTFRNPPDPNDPEAETALVLVLAPFECQTVRRSEAGIYVATGWHYFFPYHGGGDPTFPKNDPRFYWYLPASTPDANPDITATYASSEHPRAANSMAANNLTNPSIVFDWIAFWDDDPWPYGRGFAESVTETRKANWHPRFIRDLTAEGADPDLLPLYQGVLEDPADPTGPRLDLFGDPTNLETKLGDLIYHKGWIRIIRKHKTNIDPETGQAVITRDAVFFRGFDTIVADFAAKLLLVENRYDAIEEEWGLWVDSDDPDNDIELIPIGTNLFQRDDPAHAVPALVELPVAIEVQVLEFLGEAATAKAIGQISLNDNAANVVQRASQSGGDVLQTRNWDELQSDGALSAEVETAGTRDPRATREARATTWRTNDEFHGLHQWTVEDLLNLTPWGDATHHPEQGNANVAFTGMTLKLTWEGWAILFTETTQGEFMPGHHPGWEDGRQFTTDKNRRVYLRGHGWPFLHAIGNFPGAATGFFSPRTGRYVTAEGFGAELVGVAGADFTLPELELGSTVEETEIRQLYRVIPPRDSTQGDLWLPTVDSRFWRARFMDQFLLYLEDGQTDAGYWDIRARLLAGPKDDPADLSTTSDTEPKMALLAEMYNAMAGLINSVTRCLPLNALSLRWVFQDPDGAPGVGKVYYLPEMGKIAGGGYGLGGGIPVPMEEYTQVVVDSDFEALCGFVACPIKDAGDLPGIGGAVDGNPDPSSLAISKFPKLKVVTTVTPSGSVVADGGSSTGFYWQGSATIERTITDETEAWYAAQDAATIQLARGQAVWRSHDGVGGTWQTIDLKTAYEDYRWVTQTDVDAVFGAYGIPVVAAQMATPLRLINLGSDEEWPDVRTYTTSYSRSSSTRTGIQVECGEFDVEVEYDDTATAVAQDPNGNRFLMMRSGYFFGSAYGAYDFPEDTPPEEIPPVAQWKHYGTAYEPGEKIMAGVQTWWGHLNEPSLLFGQNDSWAHLTAHADRADMTGTVATFTNVMSYAETGDWPGNDPASWPAGWVYHFLTWPTAYPDFIIGDRWGLMRTVNCAMEVSLVKDHFWTTQPDISSAADFFQNYYGDMQPIFNASLGYLGTVEIPEGETGVTATRTIGPGVTGELEFTGYVLFDPRNAFRVLT